MPERHMLAGFNISLSVLVIQHFNREIRDLISDRKQMKENWSGKKSKTFRGLDSRTGKKKKDVHIFACVNVFQLSVQLLRPNVLVISQRM